MSRLLNAYTSFLTRRPLVGNVVSSAALFFAGDVIAQQLVEKRGWKNQDHKRTARIVFWGGFCFAPVVTVWYRILNQLPIKSAVGVTLARVGLDQFVGSPIFLSTFFTVMTLLEGGDMKAAKAKWDAQFLPTLKANWMVFIPFQTINMIIPVTYRVIAVNAVSIPWNAFLSLQNAKHQEKEKANDVEMALKQA